MNIREFLDQYPLPWRVKRDCIGIWIEDNNGIIVTLDMVVKVINSEFQPLNTEDLPQTRIGTQDVPRTGQTSVVSLLESASYVHFEKPSTSLEMFCTGAGVGYIQFKPQLVEDVLKDYKGKTDFINDLRGIITLNEARTKILGWEPLKGERGDQLLE